MDLNLLESSGTVQGSLYSNHTTCKKKNFTKATETDRGYIGNNRMHYGLKGA
jgi:hypothetical protein